MENTELKTIKNINEDELKAFIEQNITENLNHARHVETEIHTFTGVYMAVVAGVLAFNFGGGDKSSFSMIIHFILLGGGLLAMFLLNRWYTAFDTFMAHAEGLSFIREQLVLGRMEAAEVENAWKTFTDAFYTATENRVQKPKNAAFEALGELDEKYRKAREKDAEFFAFKIPKKGGKGPSTRDYIFGFHGVILLFIALILIIDIYSLMF